MAEGRPGSHQQHPSARLELAGCCQAHGGLADKLHEYRDDYAAGPRRLGLCHHAHGSPTRCPGQGRRRGRIHAHPPGPHDRQAHLSECGHGPELRSAAAVCPTSQCVPLQKECAVMAWRATVPPPAASAATKGKGVWWYAARGHPARISLWQVGARTSALYATVRATYASWNAPGVLQNPGAAASRTPGQVCRLLAPAPPRKNRAAGLTTGCAHCCGLQLRSSAECPRSLAAGCTALCGSTA